MSCAYVTIHRIFITGHSCDHCNLSLRLYSLFSGRYGDIGFHEMDAVVPIIGLMGIHVLCSTDQLSF